MTLHTLKRGEAAIRVHRRPLDSGVAVEIDGTLKRLDRVLVTEIANGDAREGAPEFWATNGFQVFFDRIADRDYPIEIDTGETQ